MSKRNGKRIPGIMLQSTPDDVSLSASVEEKFIDLCGTYNRLKGERLPIPLSLEPDMLKWRTMRVRHKSGDFRHTEAEMRSLKMIAEWTVEVNAEMRNQKKPTIEWKD